MVTAETLELSDINLSDPDFWALPPPERQAAFAALRAQPAPMFFKELKLPIIRTGAGYYALVRHADVVEAAARRAPSSAGRASRRACCG